MATYGRAAAVRGQVQVQVQVPVPVPSQGLPLLRARVVAEHVQRLSLSVPEVRTRRHKQLKV